MLPFHGLRLGRDPLQATGDVHVRLMLQPMALPIALLAGSILAEDADFKRREGGVTVGGVGHAGDYRFQVH